jgi:hypothetical protein
MRRVVNVVTAAAVVMAFSSMVFAQAATPKAAPTAKPAAKAEAAQAAKPVKAEATEKAAKVEKLTVKGEGKYDEATKTLTVGDKTFTLAPNARVTMGAKAATAADATGKNVMVTYTVVDGKNVASKVTIASAQAKAAKSEKKEAEKK